MIYYTHSYNRQKTGIKMINEGLVANKIYVNKIHSLGKSTAVSLGKYGIPIIYESPLYVSNFVDYKSKEVVLKIKKRNLTDELTDPSKVFDYLNDHILYFEDIKKCWKNYLLNLPIENIEKVLSLPGYDINIEKNWKNLISYIPSSDYKWVSLAINYGDLQSIDVNKLIKRVVELKFTLNTEGILFTILSPEQNINYQIQELSIVNKILKALSNSTEVLVHHADTLAMQSTEVKNLAFGIHNQTKSMAMNQDPFIEIGTVRSKSPSFISSEFLSDIHIKRFEVALLRAKKLGYDSFPSFNKLEKVHRQMLKSFEGHGIQEGSTFMAANEFIKIMNMSKNKRLEHIANFNSLFSNLPITKKEIVYKINGSKLEIL